VEIIADVYHVVTTLVTRGAPPVPRRVPCSGVAASPWSLLRSVHVEHAADGCAGARNGISCAGVVSLVDFVKKR
jgi:hypothetical protein